MPLFSGPSIGSSYTASAILFLQLKQRYRPTTDMVMDWWGLGAVLFPAFYIGTQYSQCTYFLCLDVIAKAFLWAFFWPVYFLT